MGDVVRSQSVSIPFIIGSFDIAVKIGYKGMYIIYNNNSLTSSDTWAININ